MKAASLRASLTASPGALPTPSHDPPDPGSRTGPPDRARASTRAHAGLRGRLNAWLLARVPVSDRHLTTHRNVYIVPSAAGGFFAGVLLVLLVASINYQLNLGYTLTFLLAGSAIVSMHMTHATLRGLVLQLRAPSPTHAGEDAALEIVIDNPGRARHGIGLSFHATLGPVAGPVWVDVPAQGRTTVRLHMPTQRRGWQSVAPLAAHTRFPFGLFHAWSVWRPAARVLVWPRPEHPVPPLPEGVDNALSAGPRQRVPGGEFEGVRPWRRGDAMRQIAWKKAARNPDAEWVSRETAAPSSRERWLQWSAARTPTGDAESRLSRLAAWVLQADREGVPFGLRLPGVDLPLDSGPTQRRNALDALATWEAGGVGG